MNESIEKTTENILKRDDNAHKGQCGRIFVIGGCRNMTGAPLLCSEGALRAGAGLVYLCVPSSILDVCQSSLRETVFVPMGETFPGEKYFRECHLNEAFSKAAACDSVVIGPGMGRNEETAAFVKDFIFEMVKYQCSCAVSGKNIPKMLVDADALIAMASYTDEEKKLLGEMSMPEYNVMTPHGGEAACLLSEAPEKVMKDKEKAAEKLFGMYGFTAAVKGRGTAVFGKRGLYVNSTGNSGMATAGSGDVLSGICGAFLAKTDGESALRSAVYIHGKVGDECEKMFGKSYFTSGDMVKYMYRALMPFES